MTCQCISNYHLKTSMPIKPEIKPLKTISSLSDKPTNTNKTQSEQIKDEMSIRQGRLYYMVKST